MDTLVNKVAQSGLITLDLESFYPVAPIRSFDLRPLLFMDLMLKEADFRQSLAELDHSTFEDSYVAVYCSNEAIIPQWAWMLVVTRLLGHCKGIYFGTPEQVKEQITVQHLSLHAWSQYLGKKVLIKGCGDPSSTSHYYLSITKFLLPYADRIMYGEACSFVPVWKKPKE
jgi:hypothetical protein